MIYRFYIGEQVYDIDPINVSEIRYNYKKQDDFSIGVYPQIDSITINENKFQNAGGSDFAFNVQNNGLCRLEVIEDVILSTHTFNYSSVNYDDYKKTYDISFINEETKDYKEKLDVDVDVLFSNISEITLSSTYFSEDIKGCVKAYDVAQLLVKNVFGEGIEFQSTLLNDNIYLSHSSNVLKAATGTTYDKATIFKLSLQDFLSDLKVLFNARIIKQNGTVRIEKYEYFEDKEIFDLTTLEYEGFSEKMLEYSFREEQIGRETWKSVSASEYFQDRSLIYETDGAEEEHQLIGYTDLEGATTDSDKFSSDLWFWIWKNGTDVIEKEVEVSGWFDYDFEIDSQHYEMPETQSWIRRLNLISSDSGFIYNQATGFIISDGFSASEGFEIIPEFDIEGFWKYTSSPTSTSLIPKSMSVQIGIYIANGSTKDETNEWGDVRISNIISFNTSVSYRDGAVSIDGDIYAQSYWFSLTSRQSNYQKLITTEASANARLIYFFKVENRLKNGHPTTAPDYLDVFIQGRETGTPVIINYPLSFIESIEEYQTYDRYRDEGELNKKQIQLKSKRLKKGETIVSLDKLADFEYEKFVLSQFGVGEIESAELNHYKRQLRITGFYDKASDFFDDNEIKKFFFSGVTSIRILENVIVCQALLGTDLTNIEPTIQVSKYAEYVVDGTDYSELRTISVTSRLGQVRNYSVVVDYTHQLFSYSETAAFASFPSNNQFWIHSDGQFDTGTSFSHAAAGTVTLNTDETQTTSFQATNIIGVVDLSQFINVTDVSLNGEITQISLPNNIYTRIYIKNALITLNFIPQISQNCSGIDIDLTDSAFNPNEILISIDGRGWTGGDLVLTGLGELSAAGEYAKTNLLAKSWNITND